MIIIAISHADSHTGFPFHFMDVHKDWESHLLIHSASKNANYLLAINIQLKLDRSKYNVKLFLKFFIIKKRNFVKILYVIHIILCYNSYNHMFYHWKIIFIYKKIKFRVPNYNTLAYCIIYVNILY